MTVAFHPDWRGTGVAVAHVYSTGSTNSDLLALAGDAPAPAALVADHQTGGRGRLDRRWEAPAGSGLLVSLLLRPPPVPDRPQLAMLAAGVALADACRATTGVEARLKWPNDLVVEGGPAPGKLAGVLAESRVEVGRVAAVVIGTGCNLTWPASAGDPSAPEGATSLVASGGGPVERDDLLAAYLREVLAWTEVLATATGPSRLRDAWLERTATVGRRVRVTHKGTPLEGDAVDITDSGELVLATPGGRIEVSVGDVEHLRPL